MNFIRNFWPTRSAMLHLRFAFSFFLLPVFLFALSQAPQLIWVNAVLTFIIWHLLVYPASNGYNSYFDKDEGSIALIENPPPVDKSLYNFSLILDLLAIILSLWVSWILFAAVLVYGLFSKLYSHPSVRWKKYPVISFLIVFIFQGAAVYWSSYAAVSGLGSLTGWNLNFTIAGLVCSCLIGATYPLTQVYQHEEDRKRGDITLSIVLGIRGSFWFAAILFLLSSLLLFIYWYRLEMMNNFWLFLTFAAPVFILFLNWFVKVYRDPKEANFKNMSRMTLLSGFMMLIYFAILNFI
ncbi:UbiA family prenyltransferase [Daejeonella oryzae]|uniref:UbiA family prenyltransferase n=1 Tax=Daejeonella oryzae TaxID=1122943 RepID=UPI0004012D23|nr:UbiA family prenyltransferase [Daejeonella oryzae]